MKAVILAGGRGSRLAPLTCEIPKPLVRILDKPVLAHILALLSHHGIKEAVLTVSYLAQRIRESFGEEFGGVRLRYCYEETPLGTAGGVKAAASLLREDDDESFLVISGDAMCDFDLTAAISFHRENGAEATLLLKEWEAPLQYGVVRCREDGRIFGFVEKPEWSQVCSDRVNTGVYLLKKTLLDRIPSQTKYDFSADLFPRMLKENARLFGLLCKGYWRDIGSPASYFACNRDALNNKIKLYLPLDGTVQKGRMGKWYCSFGASVDEDAVIGEGAVIGRGCRVEAGASLSSCILCDECHVEKNAVVKESILDQRVTVGKNAVVAGKSIVGAGSRMDADALCIGRMLPTRSHLSGGSCFTESGRESPVCEKGSFVFSSDADDGVFRRFGKAVAAVCSAPVFFSEKDCSSRAAALLQGLAESKVPILRSDAEDPYQSAYGAAIASSYGMHLFRREGRITAALFDPDGFCVSRGMRKRLLSAFHSVADGEVDSAERTPVGTVALRATYLCALCAALPRDLPSLRVESQEENSFLRALSMRTMHREEPPVLSLAFSEAEGLRVSFPLGGSFGRDPILALFCEHSKGKAVILPPPASETLLRRYAGISLLNDDRCEKSPVGLLSVMEYHDPHFAAARLLTLCVQEGIDRVKQRLEDAPSYCLAERFYPHDRGQGGFTESLCRLFSSSSEEGLLLRRPQGTLRIYPSAFGGYRVVAEALKTEAAEELFAYAAENIPTVRKQ